MLLATAKGIRGLADAALGAVLQEFKHRQQPRDYDSEQNSIFQH